MSTESHRELIERVRMMLRARKALPVLSEREATMALRPYGQGIMAAPKDPPVNHSRPSSVGDPGGARGEQTFASAGDSTG